jgi:16S rRNA (uracil1498-N3)-methyltransferase
MRRRFYALPDAFALDAGSVKLAPEEAKHLRDVLRLKEGDEAFVFDGLGHEYSCVVKEIERGKDARVRLQVRDRVEAASPESTLQLTLMLTLLKGEKFETVVQKATELGVTRIVPVATARADVRVRSDADALRRRVRWQRVALEAAKQCGRAHVPEIAEITGFDALMEKQFSSDESMRVIFSERAGGHLREVIAGWRASSTPAISAFIGPEGGLTDEEIARAREAGWRVVTLGGRILRAETAAISVLALLQYLCGDLA